jgi:hypothetical protein
MVAKFGQAIVLSYQTDHSLSDVENLHREVVEIWADFRKDADKAKVDVAVIMANEPPAGVIIARGKSFNFVFERKPETGWAEVDAKVDAAAIARYGLFEMGNSAAQVAPGTAAGRIHATRQVPKWIATVEKIPRTKGTFFGYEFVVEGQPKGSPVDVKIVIEHPPFRVPGSTETTTRESWVQPVVLGTPSFAGYGFDEDWEMLAGTWTVRVYHGSRLLTEKDFAVE